MTDLFTDNGNRAGIYEVCEWWSQRYPADVFPYMTGKKNNHVVAIIRHEMEAIVRAADHSIVNPEGPYKKD